MLFSYLVFYVSILFSRLCCDFLPIEDKPQISLIFKILCNILDLKYWRRKYLMDKGLQPDYMLAQNQRILEQNRILELT